MEKITIFGDYILGWIRLNEFKSCITKDHAKIKSVLEMTSKKLTHYTEPTLQVGSFDTAVIHVGVNDLLKDKKYAQFS